MEADPFTSDLFTLRDDYVPGEIGFDPLGLCPDASDELYLDYKLKELSHGRLAMVATAFFVAKRTSSPGTRSSRSLICFPTNKFNTTKGV